MKDNIQIIEKFICPKVPFKPGIKPSLNKELWCAVNLMSDSSYNLDPKPPTDSEIRKAYEKLY